MAIDTSIYANLLRAPKTIADYDNDALKMQQNRLALQLDQTKLDDRSREIADGNKLRMAVQGFGADKVANYNSILSTTGDLKAAQAYEKGNADIGKTTADTAHINAQTQETHLKSVNLKLGQAKDLINTIQTPEQAAAWVDQMYKDPDLSLVFSRSGVTPEQAKQRIPTDPKKLQDWKMQASLGAEKLAEYTTPTANTVATNAQSDVNSLRTAASSKYSADSSASTARRGQDLTENRLRNEPKGVIVQTDTGPLLVDPRSGNSRPVLDGNGAPVEAKLKPLPAQVQKGLMENSAALRKVNDALEAVNKYPAALGAKNYLGDGIRQRSDPEGINARALVADIGSLKLHDRSGAAVTASETPRLLPFIPSPTDDPETVKRKLGLFKNEYNAIEQEIRETYSREQGYRLPTQRSQTAAPSGAPQAYADAEKERRYQEFKAKQGQK